MLKGKRWIAFLTIVVFTAALSYFAREKNGAARQEAWSSHTLADAGYEDEAPYKGKVALTFDDDVIIGLSQEISYKEAVSMI